MSSARRLLEPIENLLYSRIGGWRSELIFRVLGFAALTWTLARAHGGFEAAYLRLLGTHSTAEVLGVASYLLIGLFGPTVLFVGMAAFTAIWVLFVGLETPAMTHPVERLVLISVPLYALITHLLYTFGRSAEAGAARPSKEEIERRVDRSFIAFVRVTALLAMAFTAIHKINSDFLNPELSCLEHVTSRLAWWGPAGELLGAVAVPWIAVASEALAVILLFVAPRWGILFTTLLMTMLRLANFGPIAILVNGLAFSFLAEGDLAILSAKRRLLALLFVAIFFAYSVVALTSPYAGPLAWQEMELFGVFFAGACSGILVLLGSREARASFAPPWRSGRFSWPADRSGRVLLGVFASLTLLSCLSPYFGFKGEYSFAMFSNLRADEYRWNSYVFPRWMRLFSHDVIHVEQLTPYRVKRVKTRVDAMARGRAADPDAPIDFFWMDRTQRAESLDDFLRTFGLSLEGLPRALKEGDPRLSTRLVDLRRKPVEVALPMVGMTFEPYAFRADLEQVRTAADPTLQHALVLSYGGERHEFDKIFRSNDVWDFIASLQQDSMYFRPRLSGREPQPCVH